MMQGALRRGALAGRTSTCLHPRLSGLQLPAGMRAFRAGPPLLKRTAGSPYSNRNAATKGTRSPPHADPAASATAAASAAGRTPSGSNTTKPTEEEEDDEEDNAAIRRELEATFRMSRPRDAVDGAVDAAVNVGSGLVSGAVIFFKSTVEGAYAGAAGGVKGVGADSAAGGVLGASVGFLEGVVKGTLGGGVMLVAGAVAAGQSMVRGVLNTPEAARYLYRGGHTYDKAEGVWVTYSLQKDRQRYLHPSTAAALERYLADLEASLGSEQYHDEMQFYSRHEEEADYDAVVKRQQAAAGAGAAGAGGADGADGRTVKDDAFYRLLGVGSGATAGEIKAAYYRKAKEHHPDRQRQGQQGDGKMFQRVHNVYRVLSNPRTRRVYDEEGRRGVRDIMNNRSGSGGGSGSMQDDEAGAAEGVGELSATVLYSVVFGSDRFEHYLGELDFIHSSLFDGNDGGGSKRRQRQKLTRHPKIKAFMQAQREVQIAANIDQLLCKYVDYFHYVHSLQLEEQEQEQEQEQGGGQAEQRAKRSAIAAESFVELVRRDGREMGRTPLGASLVRCIGEAMLEALYLHQAPNGGGSSGEADGMMRRGVFGGALGRLRMGSYRLHRAAENRLQTAASGVRSLKALWQTNSVKRKARARAATAELTAGSGAGADASPSGYKGSMGATAKGGSTALAVGREEQQSSAFDDFDDDDDEEEDAEERALMQLLTADEKALVERNMAAIRDNIMIAMYHSIEKDVFATVHGAARRVTQDMTGGGRGEPAEAEVEGAQQGDAAAVAENQARKQAQGRRVDDLRRAGLYMLATTLLEHGGDRDAGLKYFRDEIQRQDADSRA